MPDASTTDVYRFAASMVRRYGRDAVLVAELQADILLGRSDMDGYRTWKRVELVADELLAAEAPDSSPLH